MNRREFLVVSALPLLAGPHDIQTAKPVPHQKLGLNSYCLRAMRWKDTQILDYASGLKLDGVFLQDSTDPDTNSIEHWHQVGAYAKTLGLHIETGVGAVLPKDPTQIDAMRQQLLLGVARAQAVGSPVVRCLHAADRAHLPSGSIDQHRETMVKLLKSVRSEVMGAGLKLAIENHKDLQAWEMRKVIEAAGTEFVGSYLDTGNPVFVVEDPLTTLEILGPYAVCVHLRDSVVYDSPGGAMVQWVPLGEGVVDFKTLVQRLRQIKPDVYVYVKPITGRPPALLPYYNPEFWNDYPKARAAEFAQFLALAHKGRPYEKDVVIEDLPGRATPEAFIPAVQYQQRDHMERSVAYAKNTLDLGERWRS